MGLPQAHPPARPSATGSFAVDLRGFGDSSTADGDHDSATSAEDLHRLIEHLDVGPGAPHRPGHQRRRRSSGSPPRHPEDVRSLTAIEMGLAGFGLEGLADVTHGGSWHIGVLAAPGIPELLLAGREREFLGSGRSWAMTAVAGSITDADIDEFARTYARPDGWRGAVGLYRSMLAEGDELRALARAEPADHARPGGRRRRWTVHRRARWLRSRPATSRPSSSTGSGTTPRWRRPTRCRDRGPRLRARGRTFRAHNRARDHRRREPPARRSGPRRRPTTPPVRRDGRRPHARRGVAAPVRA